MRSETADEYEKWRDRLVDAFQGYRMAKTQPERRDALFVALWTMRNLEAALDALLAEAIGEIKGDQSDRQETA